VSWLSVMANLSSVAVEMSFGCQAVAELVEHAGHRPQ
jgi:hypothetical protein